MRRNCLVLLFAVLAGCSTGGGTDEAAANAAREGGMSSIGTINLGLAQTYLQTGELETALNRANRALRSDPNAGAVHAMLGLIYDRVGDKDRSASSFAKALSLAPGEGAVLLAYGTWLCARGDVAGAAMQFDKALADPFFTRPGLVHYDSGYCLLQARDFGAAEKELRRALDLPGVEPGNVLMALAQAELAQGKLLEARAFVQRREALGATADVLELAARIEDAAGNPAGAAKYRERIRAGGGADAPAAGNGAPRQ